MNLLAAAAAFLLALFFVLVGISRAGAWLIERSFPPAGSFAEIGGAAIHYVHVPAAAPELPPVVFLHGASGNLQDQIAPVRPLLEGRAELLFVDRPGHGWSERGPASNETPVGQAASLAALMDRLGIAKAIIVGHSFGGAVAAAFAVDHPERTSGLVFLAPASHPWPGGATSWYYRATAAPVLGRLFAEAVAYPGARARLKAATASVFSPNPVPEDYLSRAAIPLLLRARAFRANAVDVHGLYAHVAALAPRYREISAPTVIVTGDRDGVVYEEIHSEGLARDIAGAKLVRVHNLGHKPDWVAPELTVAAVEHVAGLRVDLDALARGVEARIAVDSWGAEELRGKAPGAELAPQ